MQSSFPFMTSAGTHKIRCVFTFGGYFHMEVLIVPDHPQATNLPLSSGLTDERETRPNLLSTSLPSSSVGRTMVPTMAAGPLLSTLPRNTSLSNIHANPLSALSSVAHEQLLELERSEARRRAEYEAAHAQLEARLHEREEEGTTDQGRRKVGRRVWSKSANASPDSTPFFGPLADGGRRRSRYDMDEDEEEEDDDEDGYGPTKRTLYRDSRYTQHTVYCDGESVLGGLVPRMPSCHHEECHKSYRTLLRLANSHSGTSTPVHAPQHHHAVSAGGPSHRALHRHHPYEHHLGTRKTSPGDSTPSPISEEDRLLPPLSALSSASSRREHPYSAASSTFHEEYPYQTPSTSPFLHAVKNLNMGKSRNGSRVPSRAPSPVPLHLPPSVVASAATTKFSTLSAAADTPLIGRDRHHRSHRSHPSLYSTMGHGTGAMSPPNALGRTRDLEHHHGHGHREHREGWQPYPHSHGGTPPGTPAPITMMSRRKKASATSPTITSSKHSIDALLAGPAMPASSNSNTTYAHNDDSVMGDSHSEVLDARLHPSLSTQFPPPPSRSRPPSEYDATLSPTRLSPVNGSLLHSSMPPHGSSADISRSNSFQAIPPLVPGLPSLSSSTSFSQPPGARANSTPSSAQTSPRLYNAQAQSTFSASLHPTTAHSTLVHSVRLAFGMTPIHPPTYFSTSSARGRSTVGFGSSSMRATAAGGFSGSNTNPPSMAPSRNGSAESDDEEGDRRGLTLPPLKFQTLGTSSVVRTPEDVEDGTVRMRADDDEERQGLPHLETLTGKLGKLARERDEDVEMN